VLSAAKGIADGKAEIIVADGNFPRAHTPWISSDPLAYTHSAETRVQNAIPYGSAEALGEPSPPHLRLPDRHRCRASRSSSSQGVPARRARASARRRSY